MRQAEVAVGRLLGWLRSESERAPHVALIVLLKRREALAARGRLSHVATWGPIIKLTFG